MDPVIEQVIYDVKFDRSSDEFLSTTKRFEWEEHTVLLSIIKARDQLLETFDTENVNLMD